jgi:co-chaperonin GroES (HSP10)
MAEYVKKYVPVPGNVVINPCIKEKSNNVGLIGIKEGDDNLQRGLVENLWPGAEEFDLDFKKGDIVFFIGSSAVDVPYMKTTLKVVSVDKIMGKEE